MIEARVRVLCTEGHTAWVEPVAERCQGCQCGQGLCRFGLSARSKALAVEVPFAVAVGDELWLALPEGALWRGALLLYIMPIVCLLFGALLGVWVDGESPQELFGFIGGVLGLAIGLKLVSYLQKPFASAPFVVRLAGRATQ